MLWVLRDSLHLTGTKFGWRHRPVRCLHGAPRWAARALLLDAGVRGAGQRVTTVEAIGATPPERRCSAAWIRHDVPQCGYCQSGQIMNSRAPFSQRTGADRRRHRRSDERQRLPLRDLQQIRAAIRMRPRA